MGDLIKRFFDSVDRWHRFVTHDIWYIGRPGEEVPRGFIIKQIRVVILLLRNLVEDQLLLRAAALTFVTALAIVPFLMLVYLVVNELDLTKELPKLIEAQVSRLAMAKDEVIGESAADKQMAAAELASSDEALTSASEDNSGEDLMDLVELFIPNVNKLQEGMEERDAEEDEDKTTADFQAQIVNYLRKIQDDVSPQSLGLTGIFFVIATVFGLMRNIETSFNSIWGIKISRSWYRMFSDYLVVSLLLPFLMVGMLSFNAILGTPSIQQQLGLLAYGLAALKYMVIWLAFTVLYVTVPNTKVKWRYGLLGGVVAGTMWSLASWGYVEFLVGVTKSSVIYGGFMLIPWLLTWVYFAWVILLFGAELTFAYQNEKTFAMERHAADASQSYREAVGLKAMIDIGHRFDRGTPGLPLSDAARLWNVPMRLINDTLNQLEETGLVRRVATDPPTYQPGRSLERITVDEIVTALREHGREPSALLEDDALRPLLESVQHPREETGKATLNELIEAYGEDQAPVTQEERQALLPEGVAKSDPEPLASDEAEAADPSEEPTEGSVLSPDEKDALRDLE